MKAASKIFGTAIGFVVLASGAFAQNYHRESEWMYGTKYYGDCHMTDKAFADKAFMMNLSTIELGKLAQEKATSDYVRTFASEMMLDHEKANRDLVSCNETWGYDWPMKLDASHQREYDRLAALSGEEFDRNYMIAMKYAHMRAWDLYANQGWNVYDSDLKAYVFDCKNAITDHMDALASHGYGSYSMYSGYGG